MAEAESGQERTEEPTPRRRQQAQEKGQVPRSRELTTTALLLGGTAGLMMLSGYMLEGLLDLLRAGFRLDRQLIFLDDAGLIQLGRLAGAAALVLAPLCGLLFLLAAALPVALGGWSFSWGSAGAEAQQARSHQGPRPPLWSPGPDGAPQGPCQILGGRRCWRARALGRAGPTPCAVRHAA